MEDIGKTKEHPKSELEVLRQLVADLEAFEVERKQAEKALRDSERRFRELFEHMTSGVAVYEVKNNGNTFILKDFNKAAEQITGLKRDQIVGKDAVKVFPGLEESGLIGAFQMVYQTGKTTHHPVSLYQDERLNIWVENNIYILPSGQLVAIFDDITERKRDEEALRKSERELDSIIRTTPDIIYRLNPDGKITFISDAVKKYGYSPEELIGQDILSLVHPEDREQVKQRINDRVTGKRITKALEVRIVNEDQPEPNYETGSSGTHAEKVFLIEAESLYDASEDSNTFLGIQGIARDITEYKQAREAKEKLEVQLLQAQKMEAIGTLAGGIAHDFNNILGAILGYAQLAQITIPENKKAKEYIEQILTASDRAKGLVRQILAFSRQSKLEKIPVDIGIVAKEALKLLRASLPANIEIRQDVTSNQGSVMADQTQIHQIMMNLCTNALHAMEKNGGTLDVALVPVQLSADEAATYYDLKPGRYLKLTVADSGYGMDSATLTRIFEPYFTTKEVGEGTGMGLSTVHGIVQDHGGTIKVYSKPGSETSFHILLPCIEVEAKKETNTFEPLPTGTEQVLFVDDEKVLVDIGEKMLKKLGYKVTGRTSPYEALEAFRANPDKFDLVITDMTMPRMSGENLAKEILKIRPDMPVIICTGFSNMITPENASSMGIKDFLMKPLTMYDLAKSIRSVLD